MNVSDCLDLLMSRLGNRTEAGLRATCLLEMKLFQQTKLERGLTMPWFILSETASATTTAGERRVGLPDDFLREDYEARVYLITEAGGKIELEKGEYSELVAMEDSSENEEESEGQPTHYSLKGGYFHLFPTPDQVYTVQFKYYASQAVPADTTGSENAWFENVPDLIIAAVGVIVAGQHIQDPEKVAMFAAQEQEARTRMALVETAREEAGRNRSMG